MDEVWLVSPRRRILAVAAALGVAGTLPDRPSAGDCAAVRAAGAPTR
jgi:hypothetical protein